MAYARKKIVGDQGAATRLIVIVIGVRVGAVVKAPFLLFLLDTVLEGAQLVGNQLSLKILFSKEPVRAAVGKFPQEKLLHGAFT